MEISHNRATVLGILDGISEVIGGKMLQKTLTIVIPAYNMEKYIAHTLDSMIAPEIMDDLEVLIVNDGSKDGTADIASKYESMYPTVFKLINKENGGHGSALNVGLKNATGKYYRPIDADDWVDTDALVYVINDLKKHDVDMVLTNFKKVLEKTGKIINVRCSNIYNYAEIMRGLAKTTEGTEIKIYDRVYDFNKDIYNYSEQYLYHFVTYRTQLLRENAIVFSENVFYDDMEYDLLPLPYVKTVLPIDRYLYMYRLEREGQSVEESSFIKHRDHRAKIVLRLCRFYEEFKSQLGANVYAHLYPAMIWKVQRQYQLYYHLDDETTAKTELLEFDKALLCVNKELYEAAATMDIKLFRAFHCFRLSKALNARNTPKKKERPKAWTIESDPKMHMLIDFRKILALFHLSCFSSDMIKIRGLKNRHEGERCFITCTGPSLTISDLEALRGETTIGVNSIVKAYDKTSWRPTYYALVDYYAFGEFLAKTDIPGGLSRREAFLHYRVNPKKITGREIYCLISYKNHLPKWMKKNLIKLSKDLSVCAYDCFTVTIFAIQVAIYMGFKEIYIIGADCDYSGDKIHFIEMPDDRKKQSEGWLPDALSLSIDGYKAAAAFAEQCGVTIYNSTRGGKLEVFPRRDLDEVLTHE